MQTLPIDADLLPKVASALTQSPLFGALSSEVLQGVAARGSLVSVEADETIMEVGSAADAFFVVLAGELAVVVNSEHGDEIDVSHIRPPESVGEMGLLLQQPRSATVRAASRAMLLRYDQAAFQLMYERVPGFGLAISRFLAARLAETSRQIPMPVVEAVEPDAELIGMLPMDFMTRHRVVPIQQEAHRVVIGFVDDVSPRVLMSARALLPGMEVSPARVSLALFEKCMMGTAGVSGWTTSPLEKEAADAAVPPSPERAPRLDALLRRVVAEGASDLHLSGRQRPRWRIDGEMQVIADAPVLGDSEVYELLLPVMEDRHKKAFEEENDTDFAYALENVARFRVNVFRDKGGASAVLRQIPAKILTFEQLNLPPVVARMCDNPKGLVLVTGPTGSGKSTTLAAMIDYINKNRRAHIITLEDPIEFVHKSEQCLVNQREVFAHTRSFARALKAALREDPDIVLVGEMRDLETISLALETANTGHLVFGTLHTSTAISTVDRIVDVFPPVQQEQIRAVLADTLKGVVAQALLRRQGGGRVAALETLVVSYAVANLIREGKTHQLASAMSTSKAQGNSLLNDALAQLVSEGKVEYAEALSKSLDKPDLARRCGK